MGLTGLTTDQLAKLIAALLPLLTLSGCLVGCQGKNQSTQDYRDNLETGADVAERFGLEFEAFGLMSDGHVAGQAYNLSGGHFAWRVYGKPHKETVDPIAVKPEAAKVAQPK